MAEFLGESLTATVSRQVACPEWPDCDDGEGRCLACAQAAAIIAALEDRERLRAALATITHVVHVEHGIHTHVSLWVNHAKVGTLVLRTEEYEVFRSALEGRE